MADQEVKHSPLPWSHSGPDGSYHDVIRIYAAGTDIPVTVCPQMHSAGFEVLSGSTNETTEAAYNAALIVTAVNAHAALTERVKELNREAQRLAGVVSMGIKLIGGWREAVVELENFCSERVRLKNMICAADQMDEWKSNAEEALAPKEKEHA